MLKLAIPVLHVSDAVVAEDFYCNHLGFRRQIAYRVDETKPNPCYTGLRRDGVELHVSSFSGDGVSGGVAFLLVDDLDGLHAELVAKGVPIALEPTDQSWGNREMYINDVDGNSLRFVQEKGV
jgi:catechol 2,3-dioxygenase-like lactoylglutathione lyase family enzyme